MQGQAEAEAATLPGPAGEAQLAPHGGHQLATDGKPEPCAPLVPHVPLALAERLEHRLLLMLRNAGAGIAHHEQDAGLGAGATAWEGAHLEADPPPGGELDRVAQEVPEHLAQLAQIPFHHGGQGGGVFQHQGHSSGLCLGPEQGAQLIDQLMQREGFPARLHVARLNLGVIEDVVEDLQQGFAAVLYGGEIAPLGLAQAGILQQGQAPQNAVHGGANFVAHGGEEDRLGPIGLLRLGAGQALVLHLFVEAQVGMAELAGALHHP